MAKRQTHMSRNFSRSLLGEEKSSKKGLTIAEENIPNYLHYAWDNIDDADLGNLANQKNFEKIKKDVLNRQLNEFKSAIGSTSTGGSDEAKRLLYELTDENGTIDLDLEKYMKDVGLATSSSSIPGAEKTAAYIGQDVSYANLGVKAISEKIQKDSQVLVDDIGAFIEAADKAFQEIIDYLESNSNALIASAIKNRANYRAFGVGGSDIDTLICEKFLKSGALMYDFSSVEKTNDTMKNAAVYLARIADGIKSLKGIQAGNISFDNPTHGSVMMYNTSKKPEMTGIKDQGDLIYRIVMKIGGNLSAASGGVAEIAVAKAIEQALIKGNGFNEDIISVLTTGTNPSTDNGISVDTTVKEDQELKISPKKGANFTMTKNDATIVVNDGSVSLSMGINVKKSNVTKPKPTSKVKLHQDTNLLYLFSQLVNQAGVSWQAIYNIAAAHDQKDSHISKANRKNTNGRSAITMWRDLVNLAVTNSFMYAMGSSEAQNIRNVIFVYNKQPYRVIDILKNVANSDSDMRKMISQSGGGYRSQYVADNQWQSFRLRNGVVSEARNTRMAEIRNATKVDVIQRDFAAQKITIYMNIAALAGL